MSSVFKIKNKKLDFITGNSSRFLVKRQIIESKRIPEIKEYIELEYIEKNTSNSWIDTELKFSGRYQIQLKGQFPSTVANDTWLFGTWNNVPSPARDYLIGYFTGIRAQCGLDNSSNYSTTIQNDQLPHILGVMKDRFIVDDIVQTTYPDFNNLPPGDNDKNMLLFKSWHTDNSIIRRIYWCKIWDDNDKLIRDLIPVKDQNNVVCMYDKVSRTFFYNQGSADFIAGPEISYTELEYIEGTGTQWLDFGFSPRSFDVCTVKIMPTAYTDYSYIGNMLYDDNDWRFFVANKTTAYFDAFETRIWGVNLQVNLNEACTFSFGYDADTGRTFIENKDKSIKFTGSDIITSNKIAQGNLKAFQCDYYNNRSKFRLYSLKYDGEQNQLDLIPVKDQNNVVCMYDKVSRTFFYNQGSGEFVAGPEV